MRTSRILFVLIAVVAATGQQQPTAPATPAPAVTPAAPAPGPNQAPNQTASDQAPPATFRTSTSLVVVDVTVRDKGGKPIEGLKASDFTVLEDGKPQKISLFEPQVLSLEPEPPPALTLSDQLELPKVADTTITTEAPGKVQYHDKRLMVFFFDFSSMAVPDQLRAQTAALDFLDKKITKDDMVAVMLYTSTIFVKSNFTNERDTLRDVIKALPIGEAVELAGLADTGDCNSEDTGAAFVADETEFNILNTDQKLAAIENASKMLASLPEKKQFIYFSAGVSGTGIENQAQLEASINAAMKANVTIYPIDVRGLMADPPGGAASSAASRGTGAYNGSQYNSQRQGINSSQETLTTLAADTGGKAFLDSNDLALGIQLAQQAQSSYYIVGYYTGNDKEDGKYRRITVKLLNNTTAKLEHRAGYYANKNWGKMNGVDKEHQLMEALSAGDPPTDFPLAPEIDYFRVGPTSYFVPVSVMVPGSVVDYASKGGAVSTQIDFLGQVQDETRAVVQNLRDFIKITLDPANKAKASRKNFHYDAGMVLEPGRYRMKFLVRENTSGKMGTFEARFIVPDLSADTSGLKLSSIIWSNQREPIKSAVGSAEKVISKNVVANPLIDGDQKTLPNITHVFRRRQNLYVSFDVYDAKPDPKDSKLRHVKVSMSLFNKAGVKAFEVGPIESTELAGTRPDAVPVKIQVPLKDLAPGEYVCQINVIDEVGRKFAFPRAELVIAQ